MINGKAGWWIDYKRDDESKGTLVVCLENRFPSRLALLLGFCDITISPSINHQPSNLTHGMMNCREHPQKMTEEDKPRTSRVRCSLSHQWLTDVPAFHCGTTPHRSTMARVDRNEGTKTVLTLRRHDGSAYFSERLNDRVYIEVSDADARQVPTSEIQMANLFTTRDPCFVVGISLHLPCC